MNLFLTFLPIFLFLIIIIVISTVLSKFLPKPSKPQYNYTKKNYLLTKNERNFYKLLEKIVKDRYYIYPQIQISQLVNHKIKGQSWRGAFSHINRKTVDYVICDKEYITPILAIELDDSTHNRKDRKERDTEVERIFKQIKLPLVRIESKNRNNKEFVRDRLNKTIKAI